MIQPDKTRRRTMQAVKSKHTSIELAVRRAARRLGFQYRLHRTNLPGRPDLIFPRQRKAVFVHGCFWHGHSCKRGARVPATNRAYWIEKISKNRARDRRSIRQLRHLGWSVLVIWECKLRLVDTALARFLEE